MIRKGDGMLWKSTVVINDLNVMFLDARVQDDSKPKELSASPSCVFYVRRRNQLSLPSMQPCNGCYSVWKQDR